MTSDDDFADDRDFLNYLRTAGGTVSADHPAPQLDRTDSSERKRRHTGSEPDRRDYPYNPYHGRPMVASRFNSGSPSRSGGQPGSALDAPIDLTGPSRASRPDTSTMRHASRDNFASRQRRPDVAPPVWQPDADVSQCPVCKADFTFFFRKHHCRKCGRVVCSNCSPHRITIPRQYIVQAPTMIGDDPESPARLGNPALGGGEVVRVCNPCVPDPWTPDPASDDPVLRQRQSRPVNMDIPPPESLMSRLAQRHPMDRPDRYRQIAPSALSRNRANTHDAGPPRFGLIPQAPGAPSFVPNFGSMPQHGPPPRVSSRYGTGHRHSQSNADRPPVWDPMGRLAQSQPQATNPPVVPAPQPRRQVREEDECPVCGIEMPPGESVREAHIQECIASRFSSTPVQPPRSAPPSSDAAVAPLPGGSFGTSASSSATPPPVPEGSRPRATSYRPRGMALYRATEKDCTTEDGEPQECVICFEEFETGDEMGRMECLCKFHRKCIRQWWDTKGVGSCPTHQLHE